ncbi:hypothetical protein B7463_g5985, partial [Scytalidium lignicola]
MTEEASMIESINEVSLQTQMRLENSDPSTTNSARGVQSLEQLDSLEVSIEPWLGPTISENGNWCTPDQGLLPLPAQDPIPSFHLYPFLGTKAPVNNIEFNFNTTFMPPPEIDYARFLSGEFHDFCELAISERVSHEQLNDLSRVSFNNGGLHPMATLQSRITQYQDPFPESIAGYWQWGDLASSASNLNQLSFRCLSIPDATTSADFGFNNTPQSDVMFPTGSQWDNLADHSISTLSSKNTTCTNIIEPQNLREGSAQNPIRIPESPDRPLLKSFGPSRPVSLLPALKGGRKGPLSAIELKNRRESRKQGCYGGIPCTPCLETKAVLWTFPCTKAQFFDLLEHDIQSFQTYNIENLERDFVKQLMAVSFMVSFFNGPTVDLFPLSPMILLTDRPVTLCLRKGLRILEDYNRTNLTETCITGAKLSEIPYRLSQSKSALPPVTINEADLSETREKRLISDDNLRQSYLDQKKRIRQALFIYFSIFLDKLPAWSDFWQTRRIPLKSKGSKRCAKSLEEFDLSFKCELMRASLHTNLIFESNVDVGNTCNRKQPDIETTKNSVRSFEKTFNEIFGRPRDIKEDLEVISIKLSNFYHPRIEELRKELTELQKDLPTAPIGSILEVTEHFIRMEKEIQEDIVKELGNQYKLIVNGKNIANNAKLIIEHALVLMVDVEEFWHTIRPALHRLVG